MSDSTGLIAISFLGVTGLWMSLYAGKQANEMGLQICTGVVDGTTVPTVQRWHMLFTHFLTFYLFLVGFLMIIALGLWELAQGIEERGVSLLGYMGAYLAASGAVMWLLLGTSWFIHHWLTVREAEAD